MYAKVTSGQVQPGKMEEFLATYRKVVDLMTEGLPGLKNVYVLTNPESNDVSSIAIYESEVDADELENRGDYIQAVGMMTSTLVIESIMRAGYEVSFQLYWPAPQRS